MGLLPARAMPQDTPLYGIHAAPDHCQLEQSHSLSPYASSMVVEIGSIIAPGNPSEYSLASSPETLSTPVVGEDIVIAVMGVTGAGKSSFINKATKEDHAVVGHSLHSCTREVTAIRCAHPDGSGRNIVFVDTPGFDDSDVKDADILKAIADWLTTTYRRGITLAGLLYLHRITDNRMAGAPLRSLAMFQNLCGRDALQNVMLVTTMWKEIDEQTGSMREEDLRTMYWGPMISVGSRMTRFDDSYESAWNIVSQFTGVRRPLLLQKEMVDEGKELSQTAAGSTVFEWLGKFVAQFRKVVDKLEQRLRGLSKHFNPDIAAAVAREVKVLRRRLDQATEQKKKLVKRDNSTPPDANQRALLSIIATLNHVKSVLDMAPVPGLGAVARLAITILESVVSTNNVERSIVALAHNVCRLIVAISAKVGEKSDNLRTAVDSLSGELQQIQAVIERIQGRRFRYVFHAADEFAISQCSERIHNACELFEITSLISIQQALDHVPQVVVSALIEALKAAELESPLHKSTAARALDRQNSARRFNTT